MNAEWIKSPTARRILVHWADARPAWLWSHDGESLLWRNEAARLFHGKIKKHGIKLAPEAVPIKGQVARLIRLGSVGRSSLSRIQFLAGDRPVSTTCTCTPLEMPDGRKALLIAGVDAIEPELLEAPGATRYDSLNESLLPAGADYLLIDDDSQIAGGSKRALELFAPGIESEGLPSLPAGDSAEIELCGKQVIFTRYKASPHDAALLLIEPLAGDRIASIRAEEGINYETLARVPDEAQLSDEPLLPMGLPPLEAETEAAVPAEDHWVAPLPARDEDAPTSLSSLFDQLADDDGLYTTLSAEDEQFAGRPAEPPAQMVTDEVFVPAPISAEPSGEETAPEIEATEPGGPVPQPDMIATMIAFADDLEQTPEQAPVTWRVTGRGFEPTAIGPAAEPDVGDASLPPDADVVDRVSRYNFDELSRILSDRVSSDQPLAAAPAEAPARPAAAAPEGALVNIAAETFILNRLPLGILVFRDQQVLFANRALVDLTGHDSVENLRAGGLASIFPAEGAAVAGPVSHLVRRDGILLPVNARLQSISWHGRPALMLSASPVETRIGHEGAVKAYAELVADTHDEGYIAADRAGVVTLVSLRGRIILGQPEADLIGKPLAALVDPAAIGELRSFLERPARFAETARPVLVVRGAAPDSEIQLFAEGQAGVIAGYFGFARRLPQFAPRPAAPVAADDVEPSMLVRISRGVRRPLNTMVGFAELIGSAAFGPIENPRYLEYARDIKTAGQEIATLVDELDDFARLKDGRYPAQQDNTDLAALLETCLQRVRSQAGAARVLVRSAISERLPRITADSASLTQAILNLLASAIDQTPVGGSVILSAKQEDDGSIVVNVRDNGESRADLGERFVVFRDGVGKEGEVLAPVRSSVGLALTRSLLAVNALSLSVDPTAGVGTLFSLVIPPDLIAGT